MSKQTNTWPELAIGLYDALTGRGAQITYEFENMKVEVPSSTDSAAPKAPWTLDGTLKVRTSDQNGSK